MPLLLRSEEHTSELQSPCNLVCLFLFDRKSTRLNSSHLVISYAVFCLKKKTEMRRARALLLRWGPISDGPVFPHDYRTPCSVPVAPHPRRRLSDIAFSRFFFFGRRTRPAFSPFPPPGALRSL